ncbi:hypothetical protein Esti_004332 [Eimeria stiedai]
MSPSGSPANSADGVDYRGLLYGSARPGAPSVVGRVHPYSEGGPAPSGGEQSRGPPSAASWADASSVQGEWASTSFGDWLLASSSASPAQPLLLDRVQRVGEVQRLRDAASYRGPSGISQPRLPGDGLSYSRAVHSDDSQKDNAYLGAMGEGPHVGGRGGGPPCMPPSPSVYGLRNHQREIGQRGPLVAFPSPQDSKEPGTDVYVLAPDGDTDFTSGRNALPTFVDDGEDPPSLRRRSFTSAEEFGWGASPAAEEGGGPLEGPQPFERLSPLDRLTAGIDWLGRVCGVDAGVQHLPYLYWPSKAIPSGPVDAELDSCSLLPVCTSRCPEGFAQQRSSGLCDSESEKKGFCSWYSSRPPLLRLRRFCIFSEVDGTSKDHGILNSWFHWVGDLALAWPLAFFVPLASFALAYGFFWILRKAAASVIRLMVVLIEVLLLGTSYHFFATARAAAAAAAGAAAEAAAAVDLKLSAEFVGALHAAEVFPRWLALCLGVLFAVFAVLFLVLTVRWWQQLSLCTAVLKSAAFVLHEAPPRFLALLPVFTAVAFALHTAFALLGVLHLMASKSFSPVLPLKACGPSDPWHRLSLGVSGRLSLGFLLLMALWTSAFISGVCQLIISYFTACSYFTPHDPDRREVLEAKAAEAARVVFKYHLGSAALGGLWLSLVETTRLCLSWVSRVNPSRNETAFRWVVRTVANALAALHAALSVLTQTAFVYVALLGQPLLRAAWTAAAAQKRNPVGVAFVWQIGRLLQVTGQLAVASVVTWGAYIILPSIPGTCGPDGQLSSLTAPLLFSFFVAYNVASSCMKCFGFASLTLLQAGSKTQPICYLADVEMARQEGKNTPEFAPRSLRTAQKHLLKRRARQV